MKFPVSLSLRHKGKVLELDADREIVNLLGAKGEAIGSLSWDFVIDQILAYRKPSPPKETRSEPRVNLAFRVRYKTPEGNHYDSRAGGIGGGGLFIESTTPLPVGTKLAMEFSMAIHHYFKQHWKEDLPKEDILHQLDFHAWRFQKR